MNLKTYRSSVRENRKNYLRKKVAIAKSQDAKKSIANVIKMESNAMNIANARAVKTVNRI